MKLKTLLLMFILVALTLKMYAPSELGQNSPKISDNEDELCYHRAKVLLSQIWAESRGDTTAFCLSEDAAGMLQIRPIMVRGVNDILMKQGKDARYTLDDRWNWTKSIEMWTIVMEAKNPEYDLRRACLIWNGRGSDGNGSEKYYKIVKSKFDSYD